LQFKFPYIKGYPKLMAKLGIQNQTARYFRFLIDSGADYTVIPNSYAALLGLEYNKIESEEIKVEVANLAFMHTKKTNLTLTLEGHNFEIPVLIAKEEAECLLGRKGIFEHFDITFQERNEEVIFQQK